MLLVIENAGTAEVCASVKRNTTNDYTAQVSVILPERGAKRKNSNLTVITKL